MPEVFSLNSVAPNEKKKTSGTQGTKREVAPFETKLNVRSELLYAKGTRTFESIVLKTIEFPFPPL